MHNIKRIRKYLSRESTEMLVHAFITSRVDYCSSLLYGLPNYQLNKLQRVLNASARLVCNASRFCHISPLLRGLHWLPVKARIAFKILLITFKVAHLPEDKLLALRELIHSWMPRHSCRKRELESLIGWLYPGMSAATDLEVKSDAPGAIGFGAYSRGQWFYGAWLTVQARHGDCCSPLGIFVGQKAGPFLIR